MESMLFSIRPPESRCCESSMSPHGTGQTLIAVQIIDASILCVHGGLSPDIRTLDQVRIIPRAQEVPHEGAFCGA